MRDYSEWLESVALPLILSSGEPRESFERLSQESAYLTYESVSTYTDGIDMVGGELRIPDVFGSKPIRMLKGKKRKAGSVRELIQFSKYTDYSDRSGGYVFSLFDEDGGLVCGVLSGDNIIEYGEPSEILSLLSDIQLVEYKDFNYVDVNLVFSDSNYYKVGLSLNLSVDRVSCIKEFYICKGNRDIVESNVGTIYDSVDDRRYTFRTKG